MTIQYYWRPGCPFCMMLTPKIRGLGVPVEEHNIWEDPEAAAQVRAVADGNETVPTVVIGERAMVNPSIGEVRSALAEADPEFSPKPSLWQRITGS
ncbi:glutaredoxin family protein [Sciscionella marina]|uniref:glutaredoxin family protein n=1 Tax=Sciscionella marina TaxID=508770 RepID=UPI000381CD6E|nr:glutaredoxin domain-containing protein [Sciscionella marina]